MEYLIGVLLAIVGWLLYSKDKLKDKLWDQAVDHVKEQIGRDRVDHERTEADARADVNDANKRIEELDNEDVNVPTSLDDAVSSYNDRRRRSGN